MVINRIFTTLYGITTGSLSAKFSRARYKPPLTHSIDRAHSLVCSLRSSSRRQCLMCAKQSNPADTLNSITHVLNFTMSDMRTSRTAWLSFNFESAAKRIICTRKVGDSDPVIIPYKVINRIFTPLFGIVGSLSTNYSCARCIRDGIIKRICYIKYVIL